MVIIRNGFAYYWFCHLLPFRQSLYRSSELLIFSFRALIIFNSCSKAKIGTTTKSNIRLLIPIVVRSLKIDSFRLTFVLPASIFNLLTSLLKVMFIKEPIMNRTRILTATCQRYFFFSSLSCKTDDKKKLIDYRLFSINTNVFV